MDAFLVEFKSVVFAENQTEAMARVKYWRSLAAAAGWKCGPGTVRGLEERELTQDLAEALERERAKAASVATDWARGRAIEALSTHMAGDVDQATGLVKSIEQEIGRLPTGLADALAAARKPTTEAPEPVR